MTVLTFICRDCDVQFDWDESPVTNRCVECAVRAWAYDPSQLAFDIDLRSVI